MIWWVLVFGIMVTYDKYWGELFPSSPRRGGRDIKKIPRSLLLWRGRGGGQIPSEIVGG
jgi:hypothetical protein